MALGAYKRQTFQFFGLSFTAGVDNDMSLIGKSKRRYMFRVGHKHLQTF